MRKRFCGLSEKKTHKRRTEKIDGAKDVGVIGDRVKKQVRHRRASPPVPHFYLEFSQISFYEFRKKEYSVSGMCVEQQVLEITLFHIQVNCG